jgi:hypothetical protein
LFVCLFACLLVCLFVCRFCSKHSESYVRTGGNRYGLRIGMPMRKFVRHRRRVRVMRPSLSLSRALPVSGAMVATLRLSGTNGTASGTGGGDTTKTFSRAKLMLTFADIPSFASV